MYHPPPPSAHPTSRRGGRAPSHAGHPPPPPSSAAARAAAAAKDLQRKAQERAAANAATAANGSSSAPSNAREGSSGPGHGRHQPPPHGHAHYGHPMQHPLHQHQHPHPHSQQHSHTHSREAERRSNNGHNAWDPNNGRREEYEESSDRRHGSGYNGRDHGRSSSSSSVFRRSPTENPESGGPGNNAAPYGRDSRDGREGGSGGGSILKRLTTGNNLRFRIGPSSEPHSQPPPPQSHSKYPPPHHPKQPEQYHGENEPERYEREWYEGQSRAEKSEREHRSEGGSVQYDDEESSGGNRGSHSESAKYPPNGAHPPPPHGHGYPYPHPGMPHGGYAVPPVPYGHPHAHYGEHPGQPYPPLPNSASPPDKVNESGAANNGHTPTIHAFREEEQNEREPKQMPKQPSQKPPLQHQHQHQHQQQNPYYPHHPHNPYPPPPGYYEGHQYYDPNYYPYGPPPPYPPGYYNPPPGGNANPPEYSETDQEKNPPTASKPPSSQPMPPSHSKDMHPPHSSMNDNSNNRSGAPSPDDEDRNSQSIPPPRTTRRIIGSASPIHIPRYSESSNDVDSMARKDVAPLGFKKQGGNGGGPGSVFRSSSGESKNTSMKKRYDVMDDTSAHEILLSLSKSYDHGDTGGRMRTRSSTRNRSLVKTGDGGAASGASAEERPKSPDEPPRIQHFHKRQNSDNFEPQPSPLKASHNNDVDGAIELAPSFTLFNQSFDMNLESVIGPNASFGLGPMKSLSFGLGLGGSIDYGDNLRASPLGGALRQRSPTGALRELNDAALENDESLKLPSLNMKDTRGSLQVLRASPSNSFSNVVRATSGDKETNRGSSIMVLGDSVRVSTPPPLVGQKRDRSPSPSPDFIDRKKRISGGAESKVDSKSKTIVLDNSARQLPFRTRSTENATLSAETPKMREKPKTSKSGTKRESRPVDPSLFRVLERHSDVFDSFAFLLPGARAILLAAKTNSEVCKEDVQLTEREKEIARRRVNSALCAFGGDAIKDSFMADAKKTPMREKYEKLLPDRYYEDENRLSWEIEEDPPVEISEEEDNFESSKLSNSKMKDDSGVKEESNDDQTHRIRSSRQLQRSIGVTVYPAVNAFTATEPGVITPALTDMNNFVDNSKSPESTPAKTLVTTTVSKTLSASKRDAALPMVSPDSVRIAMQDTPSTSTTETKTPQRWTPGSTTKNSSLNYAGGAWMSNQQSPEQKLTPEKPQGRPTTDLLFVDALDLRPEQFRIVTEKKVNNTQPLYSYPTLPLPYGQRKRISNAMFAMSTSIPGLTDECAKMLSEARRKDSWDFAVAQLITQVIVLTHCSVEDSSLDGLSKYLLTLGIAC